MNETSEEELREEEKIAGILAAAQIFEKNGMHYTECFRILQIMLKRAERAPVSDGEKRAMEVWKEGILAAQKAIKQISSRNVEDITLGVMGEIGENGQLRGGITRLAVILKTPMREEAKRRGINAFR